MVNLTEDEVDDLIYMARANDVEDFAATLANHIYPPVPSKREPGQETQTQTQTDTDAKSAADRPHVSALDVLEAVVGSGGNTPLHMAAGNGHWADPEAAHARARIRVRIRRPDSDTYPYEARRLRFVDSPNAHANTALHWAALNGHLKVVQLLIEYGGASPLAVNDKDMMPLELALQAGQDGVVKYLMDKAERGSAEAEARDKAAAKAKGETESKEGVEEGAEEGEADLSEATQELSLDKEAEAAES